MFVFFYLKKKHTQTANEEKSILIETKYLFLRSKNY